MAESTPPGIIDAPVSPGGRRRRRGADEKPGRIGDERWSQILDAAAEIFATKGYERTTIRDIADAVGMLSGSLYYYIDTKEDLLFSLIDDFHGLGREEIAAVEAEVDGDPLTMLAAVIARSVALNARHGARTAVFHNDFRHLSDERKQEIVDNRRNHEAHVEDLIRKAQRKGLIRKSLDARLTTLSILSMVNSIHHWYRPDKKRTAEELGRFQADLLIGGLTPKDTK